MGLAYFAITVSETLYERISISEQVAKFYEEAGAFLVFFATIVSSWCYPNRKFHTFATDHGETNVLKRESGERPELCPQRYVL